MFTGMKHVCVTHIFNHHSCVYHSYINGDEWGMCKRVKQVS